MATIHKEETPVAAEVVNDAQKDVEEHHTSNHIDQIPMVENSCVGRKNTVTLLIVACVAMTFVGFGLGYLIGRNTAYNRGSMMNTSNRQYQYGNGTRRGMMYQNGQNLTNNKLDNN